MAKAVTPYHWTAIVLAAGLSTRAGSRNKLLLPVRGAPLLAHTLRAAAASPAREIIVVAGYQAARIKPLASAVLRPTPKKWHVVVARHYMRGLSESLKAGITAVPHHSRGAIICLGDMPLVSPAVIERLIAHYHPGDLAVVPVTGGKWGNPVLLAREVFPKLRLLSGDQGAKPVLRKLRGRVRAVAIEDPSIHIDIDRPDDISALKQTDQIS